MILTDKKTITNRYIRKKIARYKQKKAELVTSNKLIEGVEFHRRIHPILLFLLRVKSKLSRLTYEFVTDKRVDTKNGKTVIYAIAHIGKFDYEMIVEACDIFAVSHIGKLDFEIVSEVIKKQYHVLAADFMHMKGTFSGVYLWTNGVVYIDVLDKNDRKNSRDLMVNILKQKGNIMIFPEGTWNLSLNEIIYDIQLGTVNMAMETGTVIIPISLEQYEEQKKFVINMGEPIEQEMAYENIREYKIKKTSELRDIMAALKYEIWEREGITNRSDIKPNYWSDFVAHRCAEWWGYDLREQIDNCYIPKEKLEYWDLMHDLRNMKVREENSFLFVGKEIFLN